mmetsp:Transcript_35844/g.39964  ORF Transcript_35844/g.39964 Transcript_35844/m.39964 type:complete len:535 (-) Transcript_35844:305-1909(-)
MKTMMNITKQCRKRNPLLVTLLIAVAIVGGVSAIRSPSSIQQQYTQTQRHYHESRQEEEEQQQLYSVIASTPRGGKIKKTPSIPPTTSALSFPTDAAVGTVALTLIERIVNKVFVQFGVQFPAQLGGCGILFFFLIIADVVLPGSGTSIFKVLEPGTTLLTKWLPVFFVPGLAMLPLAPSVGSGLEVAKVLLVTIIGFVYTLYSVAYSVLFLRKLEGKVDPTITATIETQKDKKGSATVESSPPKPFGDATMDLLLKTSIITGIANFVTQKSSLSDASWATSLQTLFFLAATFANYVSAARLPSAFTKAVHPLLTSTVMTWVLLYVYGTATGADFIESIKTYKTGSLAWNAAGAGDLLLFCLGPSVVSFAVSMFSRKKLLLENLKIVVAAMLISSVGGLFGTAFFAKLIRLGGTSGNALLIRLSMLTRNITTSLAIPVTQLLGGDVSIAVVVVVLTGIIGAQYGKRLLDLVNIQDPITRGLAVGSAAQGLGVSSMVNEADAFPFAAMAMALTAVAGTILVAVPSVKDAVVSLCV